MPRPHQPRSVGGERNLAARVARERTARGLSYDALAKRMTDVGCPMHSSATYKIEKGDPPRGISVDELIAFATVFDTTVDDLLTPIDTLDQQRARELLIEWDAAERMLVEGVGRVLEVQMEYLGLAESNPDLHDFVHGHLVAGVEQSPIVEALGEEVTSLSDEFVSFYRYLGRVAQHVTHSQRIGGDDG